ncbi:MAG: class I SAM-dependent methyltransferase [Bryobacterales bacterium]|nr:class I SAM-dependent methyltransferase [Acidobacteriota bacterium]MCB9384515.1 class I SAM-dependent methyltransferase [Bryobacterales bacterium]
MAKKKQQYRLYDAFAPFYDQYWGDWYLDDCREGLAELVLPRIPAGGRVLDLCCGTGQLARWLTACGFEVTGLDGSEEMLAHARRNAPKASFVCADARLFAFEEPFDAVLSTFDSVNHFATLEDVGTVFENVARALEPGGVFVFDVNTQAGFLDAADESYITEEGGPVCVVRSTYDVKTGVGLSKVTGFLQEGELWRRVDFEIPEYHYALKDLKAALRAAGFRPAETLDAVEDFGMPRAHGRVFLVTEKRG